jgi:type I restriction enzyme S subunit
MCKLDCLSSLDPSFLVYAMAALYDRGVNTACIQQTTGIQNLRVTEYLNTKIGFPEVHEQRRIAEYLDEITDQIAQVVAKKRHQIRQLDGVRIATIQQAMTEGVRPEPDLRPTGSFWRALLPRRWTLSSLKRVASVQTGLTLGKQYSGDLVTRPYLRVANVQDGHLDLQDVTMIEVPVAVAATVALQKDDVLMTEGGDLDKLGRGFLWDGSIPECLHQNHIFAIRCHRHKLVPKFLTYLTSSRYARDYFEATGKRTTNLASTNARKVGAFPVPLPPLDEQEQIVSVIDTRLQQLGRLQKTLESQIAALLAYRSSLVLEYVSGSRRVDAPAVSVPEYA